MKRLLLLLLAGTPCVQGCVLVDGHPSPVTGGRPRWNHPDPLRGSNFVLRATQNRNLCVEAPGEPVVAGTHVDLLACSSAANQRWSFDEHASGGSIVAAGGLCLDLVAGQTSNGSPLQLAPCDKQLNKGFSHSDDGRIRERSTDKCLTASHLENHGAVTLATCDYAKDAQVFIAKK